MDDSTVGQVVRDANGVCGKCIRAETTTATPCEDNEAIYRHEPKPEDPTKDFVLVYDPLTNLFEELPELAVNYP